MWGCFRQWVEVDMVSSENRSTVNISLFGFLRLYMDEQGICPVFEAVRIAQRALQEEEVTKAYMAPAGDELFNLGMQRLVLGDDSSPLADGRVSSIQTPGGCGALRIGAEIIHAAAPHARVWVSDPTWPVHIPLVGSVGLGFETYRYYEPHSHGVDFAGMVDDLKNAGSGDVVLLHGCCHNPCGADLSLSQWGVIADMAEQQGFLPFIDIAYQGLGYGLDEDAAGLRLLVSRLPEVIVAASCSKNLGLYRERTGAAIFVCSDSASASAALSQAKSAARRVYSMPPAHGALLAGRVLSDEHLGLISFFTVGEDEVRAWTITRKTPADDAAGVIHTDMKKGFIRAEVVAYKDLMASGTYAEARKQGTVRLEGKTYEVQDGDIMEIRFNV